MPKLTHYFRSCLLAAILLLVANHPTPGRASPIAVAPQSPTAATYYVIPGGSGDCLSWVTACDLQAALGKAVSGDQVWVAQGVYKPGATRTAAFSLTNGVAVYGGFTGVETSLEQRDWLAHVTVLSGDIDGNDIVDAQGVVTHPSNISGANSYHVVTSGSGATESTRLDGFTITAGMANGSTATPCNQKCGGGMYTTSSNLSLENVTFRGNLASDDGGGMYVNGGNPKLVDVTFTRNRATNGGGTFLYGSCSPTLVGVIFSGNQGTLAGGGINSKNCTPSLTNVIFSGNLSSNGGAIYNTTSTPVLTNVTMTGNQADHAAGLSNYGSVPVVRNTILWGNYAPRNPQVFNPSNFAYSNIEGAFSSGSWDPVLGTNSGGNLDVDPLFVRNPSSGPDNTWGTADDDFGDLRLQPASPVIDAGSNTLVPADTLDLDRDGNTSEALPYDLDGQPRFVNGMPPIVDMGTFESLVLQTRVSITGKPSTSSNDTTPTFAFMGTGNALPLTYQCVMDEASGETWTDCTSPFTYTVPLAEGQHTFQVKASDGASSMELPASYTWTIDTTPPTVEVTGTSDEPLTQRSATFTFTGVGAAAYYCAMDGQTAEVCISPKSYVNLSLGSHTFSVYAVDQAGNASQPALVTWTAGTAIYYVKPGTSGYCTRWESACDLQAALGKAISGDQVWVAQGVYKPGAARTTAFSLTNGVAVYGGFTGVETSLEQRDWLAHVTVLSGDIDGNDIVDAQGVVTHPSNISGANSYHVVTSGSGATESTRLDGFTITAGMANGSTATPCNQKCGGGMYTTSSNLSLENVTFRGNLASDDGGGMYVNGGNPKLVDVTFTRNRATNGGGTFLYGSCSPTLVGVIFSGNQGTLAGGGINSKNCTPSLTNVIFSGNLSSNGGAIYNTTSTPVLTNVTMTGNQADHAAGLSNYGSVPVVRNTILWGNYAPRNPQVFNPSNFAYSNIEGAFSSGSWDPVLGTNSGGNLDVDPLFVRNPSSGPDNTWGTADDDFGDLRLQPASPVIDAGSNTLVPADTLDLDRDGNTSEALPYDLDGQPRFVNSAPPIVDMGVYESQLWMTRVRITEQPSNPSNDATPAFTFVGMGGVGPLTYQCVMDEASGGTWTDCASPITYSTPLADGQHTFQVKASDGAGTQELPASYTWTIDATPPIVQITGAPLNPTIQRSATFAFSVSEAATLYCKLDQNPQAVCENPTSYSALSVGSHSFTVYAEDSLGNTSQPVYYTWTIKPVIYYVKPGGSGDCTSWASACNLGTALDGALPGCKIWVAQGVYKPGVARYNTFTLRAGVALYGGFAGTETSLAERDWQQHVTVLSGDIDGNDIVDANGVDPSTASIVGNNAFHVVSSTGLTETAHLDGFTITAGSATGDTISGACGQQCGGGLYSVNSSLSLANITFSGNRAYSGGGFATFYGNPSLNNVTFSGNLGYLTGGGIYNKSSSPNLANIIFNGNRVTDIYGKGGGMCNIQYSNPTLMNVIFNANRANGNYSSGGGMYNDASSFPSLVNVTFSGNQADYQGGGVWNHAGSYPRITNTILWGNTAQYGPQVYSNSSSPIFFNSTIQGAFNDGSWDAALGTNGGSNLDADPIFVRNPSPGPDATWGTADDDYGDLHLQTASPAIDAGNNALVPPDTLDLDSDGDLREPLPYDLDGQPRFFNGAPPVVDMGAHESQALVPIAQITVQPTDPSNDAMPTFAFTGYSGAGTLTYQCVMDEASGGTWVDCASPVNYTAPLPDGRHTFQVRAKDSLGMQGRPARYTWVIDTQAPTVQIDSHPLAWTNQVTATFTFSGVAPFRLNGVTTLGYECQLDAQGAAWQACASPQVYTGLGEGEHTFTVRSQDAAGNYSQLAVFTWTVDLTTPAAPSIAGPAEGEIISFTAAGWNHPIFSGQAEPDATVTVYLPSTLPLTTQPLCTATANPAGAWACQSEQALPPGANRVIATATDAAGNTGQPSAERAFVVQQVVYLSVIVK